MIYFLKWKSRYKGGGKFRNGGVLYPLSNMSNACSACTSINSISTYFKQHKFLKFSQKFMGKQLRRSLFLIKLLT